MALGAVVSAAFYASSPVLAQEESKPGGPSDATDVIVTAPPTKSSGHSTKVESAMKNAQKDVERGLTPDYTIEFGDKDDWIQFNTGEWVRGTLHRVHTKGMQAGEKVEFYSLRLHELTFNLDYVAAIHSPKIKTYTFDGKIVVVGKAMVTQDQVIIETDQGVKTYPRSALISIVEGEARERSWWATSFSLGFSANAGNSSQGSLTSQWKLIRDDGRTFAGLGYNGTIGYADGAINVNRHLVNLDVDLFFWGRFYVIPFVGQLLNDEFQNIKLRATPGAGGGVHVFAVKKQKRNHTNKFEWDLQSALGYQFASYRSTEAGVSNPQSDGLVMLRTFWKLKFVGTRVTIQVDWRTNIVYTTFASTNHNGTASVSVKITDVFNFEPSFLFLRTRDPLPEADGSVPKENDYQVVVSIVLKIE